ncbi:hypothetical protein KRIGEM_02449 [Komagataeibacter rhaeticus]|nr:hypothetical protein KRIGEM_02449 [Komagataeibacter rhaeticus]
MFTTAGPTCRTSGAKVSGPDATTGATGGANSEGLGGTADAAAVSCASAPFTCPATPSSSMGNRRRAGWAMTMRVMYGGMEVRS